MVISLTFQKFQDQPAFSFDQTVVGSSIIFHSAPAPDKNSVAAPAIS
jgi:hypothetical protein